MLFQSVKGFSWLGDTTDFTINDQFTKLDATLAGNSAIYQIDSVSDKMEFNCAIDLNFNPSNNNNIAIFFKDSVQRKAHRFLIGENGSDDALVWQQQEASEWITMQRIANGTFAQGGLFELKLIWISDTVFLELLANNQIFKDTLRSDFNLVNTLKSEMELNYTSSNTQNFTIANFNWKPWVKDVFPPKVDSVFIHQDSIIKLKFDEVIQDFSVQNITFNRELVILDSVTYLNDSVFIYLKSKLNQDGLVKIEYTVSDQKDNSTQKVQNVNQYFTDFKDVLITETLLNPESEIFKNENPEFIELYNASNHPIWINKLELLVGDDKILLPSYQLMANEFLVLHNSDATFDVPNLKVSLPTLANSGIQVTVKAQNQIIDYWEVIPPLTNKLKNEGGWSINRITDGICTQNQSEFSVNPKGASPGLENWGNLNEINTNEITKKIHLSQNLFLFKFKESLTSFHISAISLTINEQNISNFYWEVTAAGLKMFFPTFTGTDLAHVKLTIQSSFCSQSQTETYSFQIANPKPLITGAISFNEIMFDPLIAVNEYIEITVNEEACYNLNELILVNLENEQVDQITYLTNVSELICKEDFKIIADKNNELMSEFSNINTASILENINLFPLTNEGMKLALLDKFENKIDTFTYSNNMHHAAYTNTKGIALQKGANNNWYSANWSIKGTPGATNNPNQQNSNPTDELISVTDLLIPNNNGFKDRLILTSGKLDDDYSLNVDLYNANGQLILELFNNQPINSNETLEWDGQLNSGKIINSGIYILLIALKGTTNNSQTFKKTLTVNH